MVEIKYKKVEMTDDELTEKKLHLAYCKLKRDSIDVDLADMEEQLDKKLASRLLQDDIDNLVKNISEKIRDKQDGSTVPATDADLVGMNIALKKFNKQKDLDIPSRELRLNINKLRDAKKRPDAPGKQIKKLEKEIRERAYEMVDTGREAPGVN